MSVLDAMREPELEHGSVRITKKMLEALGACPAGIDAYPLPATIYTDVEKNLPLAIDLAQSSRAEVGRDDSWWLACVTNTNMDMDMRYEMLPDDETWHRDYEDPTIIAQRLACAADCMLRAKGK